MISVNLQYFSEDCRSLGVTEHLRLKGSDKVKDVILYCVQFMVIDFSLFRTGEFSPRQEKGKTSF